LPSLGYNADAALRLLRWLRAAGSSGGRVDGKTLNHVQARESVPPAELSEAVRYALEQGWMQRAEEPGTFRLAGFELLKQAG
jgi:hypothetical protein